MCENELKPELDPVPRSWNPRVPDLEPCSWKEHVRCRSCVIFTTNPQPWNNPHCSRSHKRFRV